MDRQAEHSAPSSAAYSARDGTAEAPNVAEKPKLAETAKAADTPKEAEARPKPKPRQIPEPPEIAAARRAMEKMGEVPRYTAEQLAEKTGVSREKIEDYWLSLGIPINIVQGPLFTDTDVESLKGIDRFVESEQLTNTTIASLVRAVGYSADLMATWQFEALVENAMIQFSMKEDEARKYVVDRFPHIANDLDMLARNAYRVAATRVMQRNSDAIPDQPNPEQAADGLSAPLTVGFADIVGFTWRTAQMEPSQFIKYIHEYETKTRYIVTRNGGRVVKMVGDAVLFLTESLESGIDIALQLADAEANAKAETPMRVGMAWGRVLQRFGDVFGTRVNLAARLAEIAEPNTVLVDKNTAAFLARNELYQLDVMPETRIQGLGEMEPVKVSRRINTIG